MQRLFIVLGAVLIAIGLFWPWLQKLPLGRLPGDILIKKEGFQFFFPLSTSILISTAHLVSEKIICAGRRFCLRSGGILGANQRISSLST